MINKEAEKALEFFEIIIDQFHHTIDHKDAWKHEFETIRKALQGVDECKEAFELTKRLWLKQTDVNMKLEAKSQILLSALEQARTGATIDHDHLPPSQVMGNLLGFIEDSATKAIANFNSDEAGVGL